MEVRSVEAIVRALNTARIRENWRQNKGMITLKLWSDQHQRTPVDIFVYEPFDFREGIRHRDEA
jgi:hypothetical protein